MSLGVQLIYNTVLVSDVQQSDSVLCIFSQIIFHYSPDSQKLDFYNEAHLIDTCIHIMNQMGLAYLSV